MQEYFSYHNSMCSPISELEVNIHHNLNKENKHNYLEEYTERLVLARRGLDPDCSCSIILPNPPHYIFLSLSSRHMSH